MMCDSIRGSYIIAGGVRLGRLDGERERREQLRRLGRLAFNILLHDRVFVTDGSLARRRQWSSHCSADAQLPKTCRWMTNCLTLKGVARIRVVLVS